MFEILLTTPSRSFNLIVFLFILHWFNLQLFSRYPDLKNWQNFKRDFNLLNFENFEKKKMRFYWLKGRIRFLRQFFVLYVKLVLLILFNKTVDKKLFFTHDNLSIDIGQKLYLLSIGHLLKN